MTIDGITVLKEYDYVNCPWWGAVLAFLVVGFLAFGVLFVQTDSPIMGLIGAIIIGGFLFVILGLTSHWFATIKRYEVTIDNSVNYNELTEKYNIIEQDGLIVTLEEKVNSD